MNQVNCFRMKSFAFFLLFLALGCKSPVVKTGRSFYFWRTVFNLGRPEQKELREQGVRRLYTRFFDVDYDPALKTTKPVADIRFGTAVDSVLEIVPVVFITNRALLESADSSIQTLGLSIAGRIRAIEQVLTGQHLKEVQLDCDWTEGSRTKYFKLIEVIKSEFRKEPVLFSATIRLHQIKYFRRTGVPPADRGMLMFYNMGKLDDEKTANSIYDARTAEPYLHDLAAYPLPLDIALPSFSWVVVIQNGHVCRLIKDVSEAELNAEKGLERTDACHFRVKCRIRLGNTDLFEGETLRLEQVNAELSVRAAEQIQANLAHRPVYVAIFHLNKNQYTTYEKQSFEAVYNRFD